MDGRKAKKLNKIFSVASLLLALIAVTIALVGASFSYAWFSSYSTASIESINFATADVVTLGFTGATGDPNENKYSGEMAIDADGYLVTRSNALAGGIVENSGAYLQYIAEKAFEVSTVININTNGRALNLNVDFNELLITGAGAAELVSLSGNNANDINYGFTWFMKKKTVGEVVDNTIYTPYGKFDSTASMNITSASQKAPITNFLSSETDNYDFYLVFAPEKLYWMQYGTQARTQINSIYTNDEINNKIYYNDGVGNIQQQIYYSTDTFKSARFNVKINLSVSKA